MAEMKQLNAKFADLVAALDQSKASMAAKHAQLAAEKAAWEGTATKLTRSTTAGPIKLNIGGTRFETSASTLTSVKGSFFDSMLSGRWEMKPCEDGSYFIDCDATVFPHVLNYMRGIEPEVEHLSKAELTALRREADYYGLAGLVGALKVPEVQIPLELAPGPNYSLDAVKLCASKTGGGNSWSTTVLGPQLQAGVPLSVRCTGGTAFMIGGASSDIKQSMTHNMSKCTCEFYLYLGDGHLYGESGIVSTAYQGSTISSGSTVGVLLDWAGNLSFIVDGVNPGTAYRVPADRKPLCLAIIVHDGSGAQVQLVAVP